MKDHVERTLQGPWNHVGSLGRFVNLNYAAKKQCHDNGEMHVLYEFPEGIQVERGDGTIVVCGIIMHHYHNGDTVEFPHRMTEYHHENAATKAFDAHDWS